MNERPPLEYYLALEYPYTVVPDEDSYFIKFPDLPGCMTQVEDPTEIGAMAEEIRILWLETTYEQGMSIPEPSFVSGYSGKFVLRLPKTLHRDLAENAEREGMSLNAYVNYLVAERNATATLSSRLAALEARLETAAEINSQEHKHREEQTMQARGRRNGLRLIHPETVAV